MLHDTKAHAGVLPAGRWYVDPQGGRIRFAVRSFWGLMNVKGSFERIEGALSVDGGAASGRLVVHADSVDTRNRRRDEHLRSSEFLDSNAHPHVIFEVTAAQRVPPGAVFSGILTVGQHRARLQFPATVDAVDGGAFRVRSSARVSREELGLTQNKLGMIRGRVRLEVELRLVPSEGGRSSALP